MNNKIQIDIRQYKSTETKELVKHLINLPGTTLDNPVILEGEDRKKQNCTMFESSQDSDNLNTVSPCKQEPC